jgi:phospholipase C
MPSALDNLKHIVVLMMENRSFDHMLGTMKRGDPRIDGLNGTESNPDSTGALVAVQPLADFQGQLDPDPSHHFSAVDLQIFNGVNTSPRVANMQGFINSYFQQRRDTAHSQKIMYYFTPDKLPVLTALASEFAVFNRWFSSIPGPTICNRAFAHYGTSFGHVTMDLFYINTIYKSIYQRMQAAGRTAKIYYFDQASSTMEVVNLLKDQPQIFGTYEQFLNDCKHNRLPDYSFIEPNYSDHEGDNGELLASDQHPDHNVQEGERFIATIYNAIKNNPDLWESTALLVVYDEHGGIYDHVAPPGCMPDGFVAQPKDTGTGAPFTFDRLGVRVPAVLISPWIPRGTVVSPLQADGTLDKERIFEHASIPATVTNFFLKDFDQQNPSKRSPREVQADTFLDLLSLPSPRTVDLSFDLGE